LADFKISKSVEGMIELNLKNHDFPLRILHTAFANEVRLKEYFGEHKEDALNKILAENWKTIAEKFCDEKGANILMTHLYMNKKGVPILEEPDGEKPLKIGNADLIYSDTIPAQIQYTALGHLHAFQNIGTAEKPVVYSSSPLCYSFSEAGQTKYVSIIDVQPNQPVSFAKIVLKSGKSLVRKKFDSVEQTLRWLTENPDTLVELTLESETYLKAEDRKQIYQAHSGIVHLIPKVKNQELQKNHLKEINLHQDIQTLFKDYFKTKNNAQEPNEELLDLFNEILNP
jgi:exonuclease SbcD